MRYFLTIFLICISYLAYAQKNTSKEQSSEDRFKYIEVKTQFGSFLKSNNTIGDSGLLDDGYGSVLVKMGWQPTDPEGWASKYNYPSYGIGFYSGFLNDAEVFGNPNAVFGYISFPISKLTSKNVFAIEPSLGITYNLNPYDSETNPLNDAIGARMAVYFNVNFGFTYKWTREVDILYGFDVSHFSNGSTYKPNSGLNLYGVNLGLRYNYNRRQLIENKDIYSNKVFPARFHRPHRSPMDLTSSSGIIVYLGGGLAQSDAMIGSSSLMGVFSGVVDYEHKFNEIHGLSAGLDLFYDNRLRENEAYNRWMPAAHAGYSFSFYKFDIRMQVGTYLGSQNGKGSFFMRPALRFHINNYMFAQLGLKTLDGGKADYIEYGIGFKPFEW